MLSHILKELEKENSEMDVTIIKANGTKKEHLQLWAQEFR
jgi:hypothetical protein